MIEDGPLLRRLIARRCIYGVDLNGLSVQLARLAVWIHTFVPGLPLSFLDHNLVHGNSLVGVGTIEEIRKKFEELDALPLFPLDAGSLLGARGGAAEKTRQPQRRHAGRHPCGPNRPSGGEPRHLLDRDAVRPDRGTADRGRREPDHEGGPGEVGPES